MSLHVIPLSEASPGTIAEIQATQIADSEHLLAFRHREAGGIEVVHYTVSRPWRWLLRWLLRLLNRHCSTPALSELDSLRRQVRFAKRYNLDLAAETLKLRAELAGERQRITRLQMASWGEN